MANDEVSQLEAANGVSIEASCEDKENTGKANVEPQETQR